MPLTAAFVAEGDARTADCWSGSGRGFVTALRAAGVRVDIYDAELRSWRRLAVAALSFHPIRARWRQRYRLGEIPFRSRSAHVSRALARSGVTYDAVIQVGGTFSVSPSARKGSKYVVYCDSNIAHAMRGAPYSSASNLSSDALLQLWERERQVYEAADSIWTMSESLAASFENDFHQSRAKVTTVYAGANNPPGEPRGARGAPRILFIGKDCERKGSAVLLDAFDIVRREIPNAELHMVGRVPANSARPGVIHYGVLSRSSAAGRETLDKLFSEALVFCMPSHYEPFGVAFVEAMLAELPCIGTRQWAMPEIIEHEKTGWLVESGSVEDLAAKLIAALRDPEACARMGARGRERSIARFTWQKVAERALADIERLSSRSARHAPAAR